MLTIKNQFKLIYKHLLVSILLVIIYISMSFIIMNDIKALYLAVPIILFVCLVFLVWNSYPTNRIASTIFIIFITVFLYSNFIYNTNTTFNELFINASHLSLNYLKGSNSCGVILAGEMVISNTKNSSSLKQITSPAKLSNQSLNIFFVESNFESKWLRPRQLCAIESAAVHNPYANVFVVSLNAKLRDNKLLREYNNIKWMPIKTEEAFADTPLWLWWRSKKVMTSPFKTAHLSDALRLALLWKYGGIYSDLDTIAVKNFMPLFNYSGAGFLNGKEPSLGNGFLHFKTKHPFLELIMEKFAQSYNPNIWGFNGPILLRETMSSYCKVDNIYKSLILKTISIEKQTQSENVTDSFLDNQSGYINHNRVNEFVTTANSDACKLVVFPQEFFYPYNNYQLTYFFDQNAQINVSAFVNTYSVHFYSKVSSKYKVKYKQNSAFEYFASQNCELVYKDFKLGLITF